jgi:multidrug efflux pump subunit AcrB
MKRSHEMTILSHYNIRRVIDIYGSVQDRDLGATSRDVGRIVDRYRKPLPRGAFITIRGQVDTMHKSYIGLIAGLGAAVVLVYMLIVVNFQPGSIPSSSSLRSPRQWLALCSCSSSHTPR